MKYLLSLFLLISCSTNKPIEPDKPTIPIPVEPVNKCENITYLKANSNPVQAGLKVSDTMRLIFEMFDHENISKRHLDHIERLDGITLSAAHYPQSQIWDFFKSIKDKPKLNKLTKCLIKDADKNIFSYNFMKRYKKNCRIKCKTDQPDFYHENPKIVKKLRDVLKIKEIGDHQVEFYEEYLIEKTKRDLKKSGISHYRPYSIINLASVRSSSGSWSRYIAKAQQRGYVRCKDWSARWDSVPGIHEPTPKEIDLHRVVLTWAWYNCKKGKIRNRSWWFWKKFVSKYYNTYSLTKSSKYKGRKDPRNWDMKYIKKK